MLGEYGTNIQIARQLKRCKNEVMVRYINDLDRNRKEIEDYEEKG